MKGRAQRGASLGRDEWDFSELASAPERVQFVASCWEYQREALRSAGIKTDRFPAPWLSIEPQRRPVPTGDDAPPLKEITRSGQVSEIKDRRSIAEVLESAGTPDPRMISRSPQTTAFVKECSFELNWIYSDKEIVEAFSRWLRDSRSRVTGRPDGRGRPGKAIAELWDLAVYRLREIQGLDSTETSNKLLRTKGYYRTKNDRLKNSTFEQSSRAKKRARDLIRMTERVFKTHPKLMAPACHGRFLWARGRGVDTLSWLDSED